MGRVFVTGDTHGGQAYGAQKLNSSNFKENRELTKEDYLIVAGDFGYLWNKDVPSDEEEYHYKWFREKKFTTLFVDGNHENFDRIDKLPQVKMFGGEVGMVNDSIYHLKRGEVYTINGIKIFTFGGGVSIDKWRRREHLSWWPQENPNHREFNHGLMNLKEHNWDVDVVITHDCPTSIYEEFDFEKYDYVSQLQKYLEDVEGQLSYKRWFFGHYHFDIEMSDKSTVLYRHVKEIFKDGTSNNCYS